MQPGTRSRPNALLLSLSAVGRFSGGFKWSLSAAGRLSSLRGMYVLYLAALCHAQPFGLIFGDPSERALRQALQYLTP
ncbi:hypothetical protein Pmani_014463 [Petrolisthes manimaculis]|uniref:Uncharacterized protein n=1 Tax=Petrolisthes manimaculis TaxID=1843537 RepID=A0AAE1PST3_9EUCA|nr:hypothetical protein Pmani_014463 [Petrolisthes manimaculis]